MKPKVITQHCIKSHFFNEVMRLPATVKIVSIQFEVGFAIKRLSQPVSTLLTNCGVTAVRKSDPSVEVEGRLTGSRANMVKNIGIICKQLGLKTNTVRVKRMTVQVGESLGVFHRMQKMIPGDDEKVRRMTVLGLVKWTDGKEKSIANACHTNTFKCQYTTQMVRTVLCEEG